MTVLETWAEPKPIKLTIEDFLCLDATGAFRAYAKTELIGGTIVAMNAQYSLHADVKGQLFRRVADACDKALPKHRVWTEVSVAIAPNDVPEPDIVVADFKPRPRAAVPASTVALVIEVADTTLRYDLGAKLRVYAGARIPEYWVVDIENAVVHQMWMPAEAAYVEQKQTAIGAPIVSTTIAGLQVETRGLL